MLSGNCDSLIIDNESFFDHCKQNGNQLLVLRFLVTHCNRTIDCLVIILPNNIFILKTRNCLVLVESTIHMRVDFIHAKVIVLLKKNV